MARLLLALGPGVAHTRRAEPVDELTGDAGQRRRHRVVPDYACATVGDDALMPSRRFRFFEAVAAAQPSRASDRHRARRPARADQSSLGCWSSPSRAAAVARLAGRHVPRRRSARHHSPTRSRRWRHRRPRTAGAPGLTGGEVGIVAVVGDDADPAPRIHRTTAPPATCSSSPSRPPAAGRRQARRSSHGRRYPKAFATFADAPGGSPTKRSRPTAGIAGRA